MKLIDAPLGAELEGENGVFLSPYGLPPTDKHVFYGGFQRCTTPVEQKQNYRVVKEFFRIPEITRTTGGDPEIFAVDGKRLIPAFNFLGKSDPNIMRGNGFDTPNVYWDGFQAEFSMFPYACHQYAVKGIRQSLLQLTQRLRAFCPSASLTLQQVFELPSETLQSLPYEQVALGCSPSLNVYEKSGKLPSDPRTFPYRMVGGHVHFGTKLFPNYFHEYAPRLVRAMDAFCSVPAVALFEGIENPIRRNFYGLAGEFRLPPHGLEYRTPSNAWLSSPEIAHLFLGMARGAMRLGFTSWDSVYKVDFDRVQEIINNSDVQEARKFVKEHWALILELHNRETPYATPHKYRALLDDGLRAHHPDWADIHRNWATEPNHPFRINGDFGMNQFLGNTHYKTTFVF